MAPSFVRNSSPQNDELDDHSTQQQEQGRMDAEAATAGEARGLLEEGEPDERDHQDSQTHVADEADIQNARLQFLDLLGRLQHWGCFASHGLAVMQAVLVVWWIHLLGGLSWQRGNSKLVFNWHPLLMILAFCFMTVATLSFRAPYRSSNRWTVKLVHGSAWLVAAIFAAVALVAVFRSHNDPISGFIANLYSLHSWIGMGVIGLYILQFFAGARFFAFGYGTPAGKAKMVMIHSFVGPFIYIATTATIMLGIQEKEGFIKCGYSVKKADLLPLEHLFEIPAACLVSHSLGITVLATALCTMFAMHDFRRQ